MTTHNISEFKKSLFQKKMDKFVTRATKLGIPFGYNQIGNHEESIKIDGRDMFYTVFEYEVYGDSPTINGYTFQAKIEPMESNEGNVNMVHTYNSERDFSEYRTATLTCEHCHTNRFRNFYFLISNDTTNEFKMVGHNCLANYIDLPNAEGIATFYADFLVSEETFLDDEETEEYYGSRRDYTFSVVDFLAFAVMEVEANGYVSVKNETMERSSTKACVVSQFLSDGKYGKPSLDQIATAEKIASYIKESFSAKRNTNEYENNVLTLLNIGRMKTNHAGYIVSLVPVYHKLTTEAVATEDKPVSNHMGEVGQKLENINATFTRYGTCAGFRGGVTHIYTFTTDEGNVLVWFSSTIIKADVNDKVVITKATVRDHTEYKGVKQTNILRAKVQVL